MANNTLQIHLNTSDAKKLNGSFNSFLEFNLPLVQRESYYTIYISLAHANIPYSFYAINETNNKLQYNIISFDNQTLETYSVILTPGNYTSTTIILELQHLLGPNFIITYSEITNKLTFKHITNNFIFVYSNNSILKVLGFDITYNLFYSLNRTLTPLYMLNLYTIRCLCINTTFITENLMSNTNLNSSILCTIPINTTPFTLINYINLIDHKCNLDSNVFNNIIIKITD